VPRAGLSRDDVVRAAASLAGEIGYPAVTTDLLAERSASALPSLCKQPRGEASEFNAKRRSGPLREDGGLIGYGMATAVYDVPAVERSHATLPAAPWARSCLRPGALIVPEITSIVRRPLTRRRGGSR
jgi:hypothetical protein